MPRRPPTRNPHDLVSLRGREHRKRHEIMKAPGLDGRGRDWCDGQARPRADPKAFCRHSILAGHASVNGRLSAKRFPREF
jgi:hypothetical protein